MKQITPVQPALAETRSTRPCKTAQPQLEAAGEVAAQSRQLDELFKALARCVLVDDDPAAALPLRQLRVCLALYEAPQSMSALSRQLGFSLSAMTQIADRLERASLVTRWFEGPDRRVRRLRLTPRAKRMLRLREESRIHRIGTVLEAMSPQGRHSALDALAALGTAAASITDASRHAEQGADQVSDVAR